MYQFYTFARPSAWPGYHVADLFFAVGGDGANLGDFLGRSIPFVNALHVFDTAATAASLPRLVLSWFRLRWTAVPPSRTLDCASDGRGVGGAVAWRGQFVFVSDLSAHSARFPCSLNLFVRCFDLLGAVIAVLGDARRAEHLSDDRYVRALGAVASPFTALSGFYITRVRAFAARAGSPEKRTSLAAMGLIRSFLFFFDSGARNCDGSSSAFSCRGGCGSMMPEDV